jgi:hypothetical protein
MFTATTNYVCTVGLSYGSVAALGGGKKAAVVIWFRKCDYELNHAITAEMTVFSLGIENTTHSTSLQVLKA